MRIHLFLLSQAWTHQTALLEEIGAAKVRPWPGAEAVEPMTFSHAPSQRGQTFKAGVCKPLHHTGVKRSTFLYNRQICHKPHSGSAPQLIFRMCLTLAQANFLFLFKNVYSKKYKSKGSLAYQHMKGPGQGTSLVYIRLWNGLGSCGGNTAIPATL